MQLPPALVGGNSDDSSLESDSKNVSSTDYDEVCSKQSSFTSDTRNRTAVAHRHELLGGKETRRLWMLKIAFGCTLLGFAIGVSLLVYSAASNNQEETFAREFNDRADKILDSFKSNFQKDFQSIDSLGIQATSIGRASEWPLVTLPDFDLRGASVRELSNDATLILATCPLVTAEKRADWEAYSIENQGWMQESLDRQGDLQGVRSLQDAVELELELELEPEPELQEAAPPEMLFLPFIWKTDATGTILLPETDPGPYFPIWQTYPLLQTTTNANIYTNPDLKFGFDKVIETKQALLSDIYNASDPGNLLYGIVATLQASYADLDYDGEPVSIIHFPLFDTFTSSRELVGIVIQVFYWPVFFAGILPDSEDGYILILENQCDQQHTFEINGPEVQYLGAEDLHNPRYDSKERLFDFATEGLVGSTNSSLSNINLLEEPCPYSLRLYPSQTVEDRYITSEPVQLAIFGALVFVVTAFLFLLYDCLVERRQNIVMQNAMASSAIVSSIFPEVVRDRLYQSTTGKKREGNMTGLDTQGIDEDMNASTYPKVHPKRLLKSMMLNNPLEPPVGGVSGLLSTSEENFDLAKPIADLFTDCTVLFADIAGFTAWSSQREPEQVFLLLQNVYQSFDKIARRRGVFKVETIGDCYVAVTGLPNPQKDHAIRMTKFAREAMAMMGKVTSGLEVILGPDTGELSMRIGLHSGPVIAGVLRGEKSRFQLFGDTVNTAARMESNGERNRIHISQSTANLLMASGKSNWIIKRRDLVHAKGIGEVQTYWALINSSRSSVGHSSTEGEKMESLATPTPVVDEIARKKQDRMIEWHVDILAQYLKMIVAHRGNIEEVSAPPLQLQYNPSRGVLHEVSEVIVLPRFEGNHNPENDPNHIQLSPAIVSQLRDYIRSIGSMYRANPFHSFEHASHVTLSATKLLNRIVIPEDVDLSDAADVHNYTYGITSDPLTQFAVVLSALIHDVDHTGVPNGQLANENPEMASMYRHKSLAEQNSVEVAWNLLMDPMYADLQKCIYSEETELRRFRQLIVNSVMATDIFDPDGKKLRESRWNKAFSEDPGENATDLKATIVIEHIIQAADVAHTMQHWHIYQKWNQRLFDELYTAYLAGRAEKDPSIGWYKGEIWFFDNYVIPLAKKLHECRVFGVASDECFKYAVDNRKEWEKKGEQIVREMVKKHLKP